MKNVIKNLFKEKENKEYEKRGTVRAFAVQANNPSDLLCISRLATKVNPNGFLHYFQEIKGYEYIIRKIGDPKRSSPVPSRKELKERVKKEFKENNENGVCYILCNEDVPCAYPEKPSVVNERYPGIKIVQLEEWCGKG